MKKQIIFSIFTLLFVSSIFSLEVNEDEIKSTKNQTIEFINYTGPHKVIDSIAAIKSIGSTMGTVIGRSPKTAGSSRIGDRYSVIHAVDDTTGKLDADIIIIGETATVDHIVNLRRIISAYLSSAYGYSEKDADTLAVFVTVYNAVYRGDVKYFTSKYKDIVTKNLSSGKCGLSVNYKDWPGNSQIVIPLFNLTEGGLSTVDTSVISDTKVVDSMQEDDDKNIESRKEMVDIKEREAEEASDKAKESQKKATEEQKKLDEQKKKTDDAKKEAEAAKKDAEEKKEVAEKNPEDKKAQEEAKEAEKVAEEKQEEAEKQEQKEEEQKQKTEEAKETAKEQQTIADKKQDEATKERKEIAKDQQEVQAKEAANANANAEFGLIISDEDALLSRLVKFNTNTGDVIKNSPVAVIRSRTIYKTSDSYIAIAGEATKNGAIKLVLLNLDSMEIDSESEETIAGDSVLVQDGDEYYCVVDNNGNYSVAKFGEDLTLKLKSDVKPMSCTPITVTEDFVIITGSSGKLTVLNKKDLKEVNNGSATKGEK